MLYASRARVARHRATVTAPFRFCFASTQPQQILWTKRVASSYAATTKTHFALRVYYWNLQSDATRHNRIICLVSAREKNSSRIEFTFHNNVNVEHLEYTSEYANAEHWNICVVAYGMLRQEKLIFKNWRTTNDDRRARAHTAPEEFCRTQFSKPMQNMRYADIKLYLVWFYLLHG